MHIHVDLLPETHGSSAHYRDVVIMIDVLRSCTVAPILFDQGLSKLYLSQSLKQARSLASEHNHLLLGERFGLPPEGFNYGNSPLEFQDAKLQGRSAVMVSENAPKTLPQLSTAKHLLLGSFYNAAALVARASELATEELSLVCCGFTGFQDLDDTLTAGYLAARLKRCHPDADLTGAALMSVGLLKAFPAPLEALWHSRSGQYLRTIGLSEDIAAAAYISQSASVPELVEKSGQGKTELFRFETV